MFSWGPGRSGYLRCPGINAWRLKMQLGQVPGPSETDLKKHFKKTSEGLNSTEKQET